MWACRKAGTRADKGALQCVPPIGSISPVTDLTLPPFDVVVTREVRWFAPGQVPRGVLEWFTASAVDIILEYRTDWYDAEFALDGVGMKRRGTATIDAKFPLLAIDDVDLAPGTMGRVEDWMKTSTPIAASDRKRDRHHLRVVKDILTRRYVDIVPGKPDAGCDAELASITVGHEPAWTLCFETFGPPELRLAAFDAGIGAFVADSPIPEWLELSAADSCGYPAWIGRRQVPAPVPAESVEASLR